MEKYRSYVRIFNSVKRNLKKIYYHEVLELHKFDLKNTWRILRQIISGGNKSSLPISFVYNNKLIEGSKSIAEGFNQYFFTIAEDTIKSIPSTNLDYRTYLKNPCENNFFLNPIISGDIISCVRSMKPKKSFGHDMISNKLMKDTIDIISDP